MIAVPSAEEIEARKGELYSELRNIMEAEKTDYTAGITLLAIRRIARLELVVEKTCANLSD